MITFKYKAINENGQMVSGFVEAEIDGDAERLLMEKGLEVVFLSHVNGGAIDNFLLNLTKVKSKDLVVFSRQFSILISASITLVEALEILVEQIENPKFKKIIAEVSEEVNGGARLSDSFEKRPEVFSKFFTNVVRSGESSGKLDEVLNYLADELEKDYDLTSKIKGAMIYPAFVFTLLIVVGIIMMIFVVPKLVEMMDSVDGELPITTRVLMAVSDFFVHSWPILIIGVTGLVFVYKKMKKTDNGKMMFDTILLKLPIFGRLFNRIYLVRFSRSLQTLLVGGITLTNALKVVSEIVDNAVYRELVVRAESEVEEGESVSRVFGESEMIPHMVPQMMRVGEKTGKLDNALKHITIFYTREINTIVANLMTLMEPIIMVVMGVGVGLMVAAIILPMLQMSSSM